MTTTPPDGGAHDGLPASGVRWGRFVAGALAAAAVLVGVVVAFNLLTDPWGVFGVGIFPPRVNQDRSTKADLLTELKRPPELLIYGSSRAWTVEAARVEQATGLRTFNAAVTAGRPADAYVFTAVVHDTWPRATPDFLWLLDVEAFLRGPLPPSLLAESRFSRYLPWRAKAAAQLDELGWLASWSGLQASYEVWKKHPTREKVRASWLRRIAPDGTVKTPPSSEAKAGPKALKKWSEEEVARYRSFARLDAEAETYVEKTLQLFASWGGSGVVVLTPTQPEVLDGGAGRRLAPAPRRGPAPPRAAPGAVRLRRRGHDRRRVVRRRPLRVLRRHAHDHGEPAQDDRRRAPAGRRPSAVAAGTPAPDRPQAPMTSLPSAGRRTSGTVMLPSACW